MISRRKILIGGAAAAGTLIVGYGLWPSGRRARADRLAAKSGERFVAYWIKIADDDTVTIVIPHCEMGTGTFTALSQMAAEELDADWANVRAEAAPADPLFANGALVEGFLLNSQKLTSNSVPAFLQGTVQAAGTRLAKFMDIQVSGGSSAVSCTGVYGIRVAAAATREMLVAAAAERVNAPRDAFRTQSSRVIHTASGQSFRFGELAAAASRFSPSSHPRLKPKSQYTLVGKAIERIDIPAKVNGATHYGIDVEVPDMQFAAIKISPVFGGQLVSVSEAKVSGNPGIKKVIQLNDAVVVVADRFWRAQRAVEALEPVFGDAGNAQVSSNTIRESHIAALDQKTGKSAAATGAEAAAGARAAPGIRAAECTYHVPYLAHAAMEPVNATALYKSDGTLEVWAGSQDGLGARAFCAKAAKIPLDKVTFHLLPSGGAFGRRLPGLWNFLTYAVQTAMALPGVPVKLIFTREQDMRHDYYRPNVTSRFSAVLKPDGTPGSWENNYTTTDDANAEAHIVYEVPKQTYHAVKVVTPVPTGPWRSVEFSWHGFFVESFIDELAHLANRDPFEYRRALLQHQPRHLATLELAAAKAGWGTPPAPGRARGIAMVECFGSIAAHVAEVEVSEGALKVHRITSAVDCGLVVNPDGFKAQIEGGIVFGLSAALNGEITIARGAVENGNFPDYPLVRLANCPLIEVHVRESDAPVGGAGEPGTPAVAPALTNAIFAATGVR
ncbi:MAG TPA: molybdopterin cofactor-binding domain-containing protein, partial [Steroidobacteraceae bacterium]|nr:molybdopterin cofactor-binding domain-containing protein [Steroidobacteraceae bacterium]